jgi:hypothetical protein
MLRGGGGGGYSVTITRIILRRGMSLGQQQYTNPGVTGAAAVHHSRCHWGSSSTPFQVSLGQHQNTITSLKTTAPVKD